MVLLDHQLAVAGLMLGAGSGYHVARTDGLGRDIRSRDYDRANGSGSVLGPDYSNGRRVLLDINIDKPTAAQAMAAYDVLAAAWNSTQLTEGRQGVATLQWKFPGQVTRRIDGRPRNLVPQFEDVESGWIACVAEFYAPKPEMLSDELLVIDVEYGAGGMTLANNGNNPATVQWDVYGQATNPALIRNEADRFDLTTAIGAGDFYRVRTDAKTVTRASDSGNLYPVFSGTWLEVPAGGAIFRSVKASGSGLRIRGTYRHTWM